MFTLKIETDNAAFDANPEWEIARILCDAANQIEAHGATTHTKTLRDVNGNKVGTYTYEAPDSED